jgi:hypothetical protein
MARLSRCRYDDAPKEGLMRSISTVCSAVGGTALDRDERAFIWDAEHGMRDLAGVLTVLGADLTG